MHPHNGLYIRVQDVISGISYARLISSARVRDNFLGHLYVTGAPHDSGSFEPSDVAAQCTCITLIQQPRDFNSCNAASNDNAIEAYAITRCCS